MHYIKLYIEYFYDCCQCYFRRKLDYKSYFNMFSIIYIWNIYSKELVKILYNSYNLY